PPVVAHKQAHKPKEPSKAQKRADYIKWWKLQLHLRDGKERKPLSAAERAKRDATLHQQEQAARQQARARGEHLAKARLAAQAVPAPAHAEADDLTPMELIAKMSAMPWF